MTTLTSHGVNAMAVRRALLGAVARLGLVVGAALLGWLAFTLIGEADAQAADTGIYQGQHASAQADSAPRFDLASPASRFMDADTTQRLRQAREFLETSPLATALTPFTNSLNLNQPGVQPVLDEVSEVLVSESGMVAPSSVTHTPSANPVAAPQIGTGAPVSETLGVRQHATSAVVTALHSDSAPAAPSNPMRSPAQHPGDIGTVGGGCPAPSGPHHQGVGTVPTHNGMPSLAPSVVTSSRDAITVAPEVLRNPIFSPD